ncbi:MAG: zinc metalloprotease HtpX [Candidatus Binatia bacterium]|nr:zinc metalloprotease HtpX [Candidatus Binatia bacterium]
MANSIKTTLLLGLLTGLILWFGQLFGGSHGMVVAFLFAVLMNFGSYWFSDKIVLAMYRARPVSEAEAPELYRMVHNLAMKAGIPMPRVYIIPSEAANAFATGRNPSHAAVAVTEGILRIMNMEELEGVLAHELSHVKNRDILISSIAATLAGALMLMADMLRWGAMLGAASRERDDHAGGVVGLIALSIVAPLAAMLIQLAISRAREFEADASAARILGTGEPLARALEKLEFAAQRYPLPASAQTAHLFIVNPLRGDVFARLFSTHPPVEERIRRLRSMEWLR